MKTDAELIAALAAAPDTNRRWTSQSNEDPRPMPKASRSKKSAMEQLAVLGMRG